MNDKQVDKQLRKLLRRIAIGIMVAMIERDMSPADIAEATDLPVASVRATLCGENDQLTIMDISRLEAAMGAELAITPLRLVPIETDDDSSPGE